MKQTLDIIRRGIDQGLHAGAQLLVWRNGETIFDDGIGQAAPDAPMTRDTINLWWSSCKPLAGIAIAQLWERERLDLDDPVARHIPEFAVHEKDKITIRQCLTHTAGFDQRYLGIGVRDPSLVPPMVDTLRADPPVCVMRPGEHISYSDAGYLLAGHLIEKGVAFNGILLVSVECITCDVI